MLDSPLNEAERRLQPRFIKRLIFLTFLAPSALLLEGDREDDRPDRTVRPPATATIRATPLPVPANDVGLKALWELTSNEPRFGGLSGLAWNDGEFLAVSDRGALLRWPAPGGSASFTDLSDGPGAPQWKINRDAEAITQDAAGRGWWVTFEQTHGAWLFDKEFKRVLGRRDVRLRTAWRNWGVEAAVSLPEGLLLLPEDGSEAILLKNKGEERRSLSVRGAIADAVALDGEDRSIIVAVRQVRPWGISNRLGWLTGSDTLSVRNLGALPLGQWDNVEGLALEKRTDGADRLWFVTDSDYTRRTLLGWVEVDAARGAATRPGI